MVHSHDQAVSGECITGVFAPNGAGFVTFTWNPQDSFVKPIIITLLARGVPSIPAMKFGHLATVRFTSVYCTNSAKDAPNPIVTRIFSFADSNVAPAPREDPVEGGLPEQVLKDLITMPVFNVLFAVGLPENEVLPTLSYSDFIYHSKNDSLTAEIIEQKIAAKYSSGDNEKKAQFLAQLNKHKGNTFSKNKTILLFPGWGEFTLRHAFDLVPKFERSGFQVIVSAKAHPYTTPENMSELNPHICGNYLRGKVDQLYFFDTLVGLGTMDFSLKVVYDFTRSAHKFFFVKFLKQAVENAVPDPAMFRKPKVLQFATYKGLTPVRSASEAGDNFLLASVEKSQRKALDVLPEAGIQVRCLPDPDDLNKSFVCCELYAREEEVAKEAVHKLLTFAKAQDKPKEMEDVSGIAVCESSALIDACSRANGLRILKIAVLNSVRDNRSAILRLLERIGGVVDAIPISLFYYKIRLADGEKGRAVESRLKEVNKKLKSRGEEPLFHSIYDGDYTLSLLPPPPPKPEPGRIGFLVIEEPPPQLTFAQVKDWIVKVAKIKIVLDDVTWGVDRSGSSCIIARVYCPLSYDHTKQSTININEARYRILFSWMHPPAGYRRLTTHNDLKTVYAAAFKPQDSSLKLPSVVESVLRDVLGDDDVGIEAKHADVSNGDMLASRSSQADDEKTPVVTAQRPGTNGVPRKFSTPKASQVSAVSPSSEGKRAHASPSSNNSPPSQEINAPKTSSSTDRRRGFWNPLPRSWLALICLWSTRLWYPPWSMPRRKKFLLKKLLRLPIWSQPRNLIAHIILLPIVYRVPTFLSAKTPLLLSRGLRCSFPQTNEADRRKLSWNLRLLAQKFPLTKTLLRLKKK